MRIEAGPRRHTSSSGVVISVDERLSQEMVDRLVSAMNRAGKQPNEIHAAELPGDGGVILECFTSDPLARGYERVRVCSCHR